MDINEILQGLGSIGGQSTQNVVRQVGSITKQSIAQETLAQSKVLEANAVIENQRLKGELEAQQNARAIATSLGTNGSDSSNIMGFLSQRMRESAVAASQAARERTELESNNDLFSNPIGFARDLIFGDEIRNRAEATAAEFQTNSALLQGLNTATQQSTATQNAIAETLSDASLAAAHTIQAENQTILAAQARQKLAGVDMDMALKINTLNAQQIAQANAAAHLRIAQQNAELTRLQKEAVLEDKKQTAESQTQLLDAYNASAKLFNFPPAQSFQALKTLQQINKSRVDWALMRGMEIQNPEMSGGARLGSNPLEALQAIQTFNLQLPASTQQTAKKLTQSISGLNPDALVVSGAAKNTVEAQQLLSDKKQLPQLQQRYLETVAESQRVLIKPGDSTNIYALPNLDSLKGKPYLESNRFAAQYIAPSVVAGGAEFDPATMIKLGADAIEKGEATSSEVTDAITWVANQLMATNNAVNGYRSLGLNPMTSVNMPVTISDGDFTKGIGTVDLTDPTAVTKAIVTTMSKRKTFESVNRWSTGFFGN